MPSVAAFSMERMWNKLGLHGFWRPGKPIFSRAREQREAEIDIAVAVAESLEDWTEPSKIEATDEQFLEMAEADGHFDFLEDPAEDVYTWEDGEAM